MIYLTVIRIISGCSKKKLCVHVVISEQAMKRSRSPDTPPPKRVADIVKLNVGGRVFDTTASTLSVSRFFEPLLEGRMDSGKDRNGRLFIDRDGSLFAILLNYMCLEPLAFVKVCP